MSSALSSAAETWVRTLLAKTPFAETLFVTGVAVNSITTDGFSRDRVSKDKGVRALCASSTITIGRRNRRALERGHRFSVLIELQQFE